ncbi:MAG: ABC transporter permease [Fibromonadaceae bacterium]|jgi:phospholipid/cholesterol/gamma-HCH transport system permease protein|nr:ABC transporter permease [Fibromonadaceae bacterium]
MNYSASNFSMPGRAISKVGYLFLQSHVGQLLSLFFLALHSFFNDRGNRKIDIEQIIAQVFSIGVKSLPLIFIVGTILGSVLIINTAGLVPKIGFGNFFGNLMVIAIIRELGPILTGFLIAGRSGSSLTTRIASMKVNSEIDALETLGINPMRFLILPALIGGIIAMLIANCFFCVSAIGSGFLVVKIATVLLEGFFKVQLEWNSYFISILVALKPIDFVMGFVKPCIFAAIIATNACYYGTRIKIDQRAVPIATSRSVVSSFIFIVASDLLLSFVYILDYINSVNSVI